MMLEYVTPDALQMIERAGRTCYKSEDRITDDSAATFVKMIMGYEHASVLEHAVASFRMITDRGVTHEVVRHRIASFSQESTRYCNYGKDKFGKEITVILPVWFDPVTSEKPGFFTWKEACEASEKYYFELLEMGQTPQ